jgi:hypothetical protein
MTQEHPITPPPKLIRKWNEEAANTPMADQRYIATQAARWGADQELEACCEWIANGHSKQGVVLSNRIRAVRRPKPPSLKEQALLQLDTLNADLAMHGMGCDLSQIRRALESLPE